MRLEGFVTDARARIEAGYYRPGPPLKSNGSLVAALARDDGVIAELKPRSPSEGRILTDDPVAVLNDYVHGGAAAISVLTDPDHFDGSMELLRQAHATGLPTLMKDFIVDPVQVDAAAAAGASAILLIERILEPTEREALVQAAHAQGLEVLLEVYGPDWDTAKDSQADIIGVNARDLDTLQVDLEAQRRLIARIDRPTVALSGVRNHWDRLEARQAGAHAVLVGTSLIRHPLRRLALQALRRPLAKVCGIRSGTDLAIAMAAGADLVGFICGAPDSPRDLDPAIIREMAAIARAKGIPSVLVTPERDARDVQEMVAIAETDLLQWHHASTRIEGVHLLAAVGPDEPLPDADGYVLDAATGTGGTGATHDWHAARKRCPPEALSLIAGGLHADNAAAAVHASRAWGADASSGLETDGAKDADKVQAFVSAVHATSALSDRDIEA